MAKAAARKAGRTMEDRALQDVLHAKRLNQRDAAIDTHRRKTLAASKQTKRCRVVLANKQKNAFKMSKLNAMH